MKEHQIIKDHIVIGRFKDEEDRNIAFDKYCNSPDSSYFKREVTI